MALLKNNSALSLLKFSLVCWLGLVFGYEEPVTGTMTSNRVSRQMLWSMPGLAGNTYLPHMMGIPSMSLVWDFQRPNGINKIVYFPKPVQSVYEWPDDHRPHRPQNHELTYCPSCPNCTTDSQNTLSDLSLLSCPTCPVCKDCDCPATCPPEPVALFHITVPTNKDCTTLSSSDPANFLKCSRITAEPFGHFSVGFYQERDPEQPIGSTVVIGFVVTCPKTKVQLNCDPIPAGYAVRTQNKIISDGTANLSNGTATEETFMQVQISQVPTGSTGRVLASTIITCGWDTY